MSSPVYNVCQQNPFSGLRAKVEVEADLLGVEVLVDQQVDDDGQLLGHVRLAALLKAGQQVAELVQNGLNLSFSFNDHFNMFCGQKITMLNRKCVGHIIK